MTTSQDRSYTPARKAPGRLDIICGSMFSGKTEELMRRLRHAEFAKKNVLTLKHLIDSRAHHQCILSHDGQERSAHPIDNTPQGIKKIFDLVTPATDVVGIDEVQFFPQEVIGVILTLVNQGVQVIASGLDLDFRGEPFGLMPTLMAYADSVVKLQAVCSSCGAQSHFSQRIINGQPASYDDPIILVGAAESYEPRCRSCFVIDKQPLVSPITSQ
ncbi:MAG: thymidine kinase [Candidatus Dependentiae bacterium]|jgi:thymidine kinase